MDGRQALSRLFLFPPPPSLPRNPAQKWRLRKSENIRGWGKRRRERGRRGGRRRLFLFFTPDMCSCLCAGGREEEKKKNIVHHFLGKEAGRKGKKKGGGRSCQICSRGASWSSKEKGGKESPTSFQGVLSACGTFLWAATPEKKLSEAKEEWGLGLWKGFSCVPRCPFAPIVKK